MAFYFTATTTHPISARLRNRDRLILCLAAASHDYRHLGRTNTYVVSTQHALSLTYTDVSVQERMHVSEALRVMKSIGGAWPKERENAFMLRQEMTAIILATDLACSGQYITDFVGHVEEDGAFPFDDEKAKRSYLCMVMKVCDVSHPLRPLKVHLRWSRMLLDEFFLQGDDEKAAGLVVSPLCDRSTVSVASSQTGFIDFVVRPTIEPLVLVTQSAALNLELNCEHCQTDGFVSNLKDNYAYWKDFGNLDSASAIKRIESDMK